MTQNNNKGNIFGVVPDDTAYDKDSWNGNFDAATKNALRDKLELIIAGPAMATSTDPASSDATTTAIVDAYGGVVITLTGAGNAQTIADPTITTPGKDFTAVNKSTSTNSIDVNGITLEVGRSQRYIWGGAAWGPVEAVDAGDITFIPVGTIVETNIQSAVAGVATRAVQKTGDTMTGVFTVKPDGTNEVFQINDGTIDLTDGNAGTTGILTIDSSGNLSYNKNFAAVDLDVAGDLTVGAVTRITMGGGTNDDGIVFGPLGTATKGIDFSGSGLSGDDYLFYLSSSTFLKANGDLQLDGSLNVATVQPKTSSTNLTVAARGFSNLVLSVDGNSSVLMGDQATAIIGSITNGESSAASAIITDDGGGAHGLSLAAGGGDFAHITDSSTAADEGFYQVIADDGTNITLDRVLSGTATDLDVTFYKDVIAFLAANANGHQQIMGNSHSNVPLILGGYPGAGFATGGTSQDIAIGNNLYIANNLNAICLNDQVVCHNDEIIFN